MEGDGVSECFVSFSHSTFCGCVLSKTLTSSILKNIAGKVEICHSTLEGGEIYHLDKSTDEVSLDMEVAHSSLVVLTETSMKDAFCSAINIQDNTFSSFRILVAHSELSNASGFEQLEGETDGMINRSPLIFFRAKCPHPEIHISNCTISRRHRYTPMKEHLVSWMIGKLLDTKTVHVGEVDLCINGYSEDDVNEVKM